eukprot:s2877_g4.t1
MFFCVASIGPTKSVLQAAWPQLQTNKVLLSFIAGSLTGSFAEVMTNPPDQVKTMTQAGVPFFEAVQLAARHPFRGAGFAGLRKGIIRGINWGGLAFFMRVAVSDELEAFAQVLDAPVRPVCAILGGAKVSDKIQLIKNMLDKVDAMIIGGGMAFTFIKVIRGISIGNSLFDEEGSKIVPEIMAKAKEKGVDIVLPIDFICSSKYGEDGEIKNATVETGIPDGFMGLDCGPETNKLNAATIARS